MTTHRDAIAKGIKEGFPKTTSDAVEEAFSNIKEAEARDKLRIERIVEKIAKNTQIADNFEDIRVLNADSGSKALACCDVKRKIAYLNPYTDILDDKEFRKVVVPLLIHEMGHIEKRIASPATDENDKMIVEQCKDDEGKYSHDLLNIIMDMEIHFQYNIRKRLKVSHRAILKELLTMTREKLGEDNILLCFEYDSPLQLAVREVIADRTLSLHEKYKRVHKILDDKGKIGEDGNPKGMPGISDMVRPGEGEGDGSEGDKEGEGGESEGEGEGKGEGKGKDGGLDSKSQSVKGKIDEKGEENKVREQLRAMGFSDKETDALIEERSVDDIVEMIEHLTKSFDRVLPDLYEKNGRERVREHIRSAGDRLNGYRKIRDMDEITQNIEDFVTVGEYDLDEIRIPVKIKRKSKSIVFIIRDVSGSVSSEPLDRIMRDATVALIKIAQQRKYRVAVMDFSTQVNPLRDSRGKVLTNEYNILLAKSMLFKTGSSTILTKALAKVDEVIEDEELRKNNVNVFIITDSLVDDCSKAKIEANKVKMVGLWAKEGRIVDNFTDLVKRFKGKIYEIEDVEDKLVATLYDEFD